MNHKPEKILIIQSMGLGDLWFALPFIRAIKKNYPREPISFLTNRQNQTALELLPEISETITYEKTSRSFIETVRTLRSGGFTKVFVLNPIFKGSLLAWLSGAPVRVGYFRDFERQQTMYGLEKILLTHAYAPQDKKIHEIDRYLELLEKFGINLSAEDKEAHLTINEKQIEKGSRLLSRFKSNRKGPLCVIHLGAGWGMRKWPLDKVLSISRWLISNYDAKIVLTGGDGERLEAQKILSEIGHDGVQFCGETTIPELAGILSLAQLVITCDTGALHIAAALQAPTIALFGPGDLVKVKPRSKTVSALYHELPCSPCRFQYTQNCQSNLCMQDISVEETADEIKKKLGAGKGGLPTEKSRLPVQIRRILYLQSTAEVGGTDVTLLRTVQALDKKLFEPHVLSTTPGPFAKDYESSGCKTHYMKEMRKLTSRKGYGYLALFVLGYLPAVFKIAALIREEKIDIVHSNTIHNWYGFLAAKIAGVKHVWHIREVVVQSSFIKNMEIWLVENFSHRFLVMSNAISEAFLRKDRGFPSNAVKLYDGVDLEKFNPLIRGGRIRGALSIPAEAPLVGMVCRLDPWKGLELFIDAAKKVYDRNPKARFLICGGEIEGHEGYEQKLKQKAESLGLGKVIFFSGWKFFGKDIPEVYRAMNISVQCPIFPEPYGLATIEAMASGIPLVAMNEGGSKELCVNGVTGILVKPRDPEALAEGILELLAHPEKAQVMGTTGRKRAEALFDYQKCTRNLERLYADILDL